MFPSSYVCSGCQEEFKFDFHYVYYYVGVEPLGKQVADADLLAVPVRPAWCKDCDHLCVVEDIASLRDFENTYGAVRSGRSVEYPINTEYMTPEEAANEVAAYLRWRMGRHHVARALCCGGANYQFMDVAHPLFKHAECDFGVVESKHAYPGPYCGPGPGVYGPANTRLYDAEGALIGRLTWRKREECKWDIEPIHIVYDVISISGNNYF